MCEVCDDNAIMRYGAMRVRAWPMFQIRAGGRVVYSAVCARRAAKVAAEKGGEIALEPIRIAGSMLLLANVDRWQRVHDLATEIGVQLQPPFEEAYSG